MRHPAIRRLQGLLVAAGTLPPQDAVDGVAGRKTRDAVIAFKRASGLNADAIVGKRAWTKLVAG